MKANPEQANSPPAAEQPNRSTKAAAKHVDHINSELGTWADLFKGANKPTRPTPLRLCAQPWAAPVVSANSVQNQQLNSDIDICCQTVAHCRRV